MFEKLLATLLDRPKGLTDAELQTIAKAVANNADLVDALADNERFQEKVLRKLNLDDMAKKVVRRGEMIVFVVALALAGLAVVWKTTDSFEKRIESSVKDRTSDLTNRVGLVLATTRQEITNTIRRAFQADNISNLVASVAAQDAAALMQNQIVPEVTKFKQELQKSQMQVIGDVSNIQQVLTFTLNATAAIYDSRGAFIEVKRFADAGPKYFTHSTYAATILQQILGQAETDRQITKNYHVNIWEGTTNTDATASFDDYLKRLVELREVPFLRVQAIRRFWEQERFQKALRMDILVGLATSDSSLKSANEALNLLEAETHLGKTLLTAEQYLDWWKDHRSDYVPTGSPKQ